MYIYIYWLIEHLIIAYVGKNTFKNWLESRRIKGTTKKAYFSYYCQILQIELLKITFSIWLCD